MVPDTFLCAALPLVDSSGLAGLGGLGGHFHCEVLMTITGVSQWDMGGVSAYPMTHA